MAKTYDSYKDSGIAWIGEIPSEWKVCRYKNLCIIQSGSPFDSSKFSNVEGFPLIRIRDITSGRIETYYEGEYSDEFIVHKGDLLVGMDGDFNVRIWQNNDALLNQRCCRIFANNDVDQTFIYFTLPYILERINKLAYSTTVKHLSTTDLYDSFIMLPSLKEQHSIASFLDTKCGEIDSLISLQEEMISELQAYKQSVITEAVTKGLDPNAKMKDSGVEWIGKIPSAWEVKPHKRVMKKIKFIQDQYQGEDIISLSMNGVVIRNLDAGGKMPTTFNGYQKVYPGNLLLCLFDIDVTPRCVGLIKDKGVTSPAYSQFEMLPKAYAPYYDYLLRYIDDKKSLLHLSKNLRSSLTETDFGQIYTIQPPLSEQQAIASYLDAKTSQIDSLISLKQQKIDELKSYKKSIIYEYVTGKKRV